MERLATPPEHAPPSDRRMVPIEVRRCGRARRAAPCRTGEHFEISEDAVCARTRPCSPHCFDIPLPPDRNFNLEPEEVRRRQLAALVRLGSRRGARYNPPSSVFEDLQWADPTSLDLLRALSLSAANKRRSSSSRPRGRSFTALGRCARTISFISLGGLDRAQAWREIGHTSPRRARTDRSWKPVRDRAGGVPLFVEEVTRLLFGARRCRAGHTRSPRPCTIPLLPASTGSGPARKVAQIGAVLGHDSPMPAHSSCGRDRGGSRAKATPACNPPWTGREGRYPVRRGRAAADELSLQARADPGRGLRQPAQEPPPGAAPPRRRNPARPAGTRDD